MRERKIKEHKFTKLIYSKGFRKFLWYFFEVF